MKKRLLLVKPDIYYFPIGIAHIATALRKNGLEYDFLDMTGNGSNLWQERLRHGEYYAVASGGQSKSFFFFQEFFTKCRELSPETVRIVGGSLTYDLDRDLLFDNIPVHYGVVGEGEETFPELLNFLIETDGEHPSEIQGLIYRGGDGDIVTTKRRKPIDIKNNDVSPTWDDIDMNRYLQMDLFDVDGLRTMPLFTGRGCIGKCIFCSSTNGPYRMRRVENVINEMRHLTESYDFDAFIMLNEIMYPTEKQMREFLEAYKKSGINKKWITCLRADIGVGMLKDMKDAGCICTSVGLESGSDRVLQIMRKGIVTQQVIDFHRESTLAGLYSTATFIFGNAGETEEELTSTVDLLIRENIHADVGGLLISYPGTAIYKQALADGRISDQLEFMRDASYNDSFDMSGDYRNTDYINHSNMPDEVLFRTFVRETRRYRTHLFNRLAAENMDFSTLKGTCAVCGAEVSFTRNHRSVFGRRGNCHECYELSYPNIFTEKYYADHAQHVHERLEAGRNVAIYGVGTNASALHKYDVFGIDFDSVECFIRENLEWSGKWFYNTPVVPLEDFNGRDTDLVLISDTICLPHAWRMLRRAGVPDDRIVSLTPYRWYRDTFNAWHNCGMDPKMLADHAFSIGGHRAEVFRPALEWTAENWRTVDGRRPVAVAPAGEFGAQCAAMLQEMGVPVRCLLDNYKSACLKKMYSFDVFHPESAPRDEFGMIFMATPSFDVQVMLYEQFAGLYGRRREDLVLFGDGLFGCEHEHAVRFFGESEPRMENLPPIAAAV